MPFHDITAAKAELLAEREPITLRFSVGDFTFPAVMPAAVELEQMALREQVRGMAEGEEAPAEGEDRLMRAAFGDQYEELIHAVPQTELVLGLADLLSDWMEPYADPNLPARLQERAKRGATILNGSSLTTGGPSKPTSGASTGSTSPAPSGGNNGSHGGASRRSTRGSPGKP